MSKDIALIPTEHEMKALETICKYAVESKYFQSLGGMPGVMCIAMYAREIGVSPMQAIMGGFSNVLGKITMSAELMHSLLRGAGVRLKIIQSDSVRCEIHGKRSDTGDEYTSVYTIEDARKANLIKTGGAYEKNPSDMLFARCISRLRRRLAPDIATKAYVEGELEEAEVTMESTPVEEVIVVPAYTPPSDALVLALRDKFKPVENMDYDLLDFVKFISEKSSKTAEDTIKQAIKHADKFSKSYLKWVEEKIAMEVKPEEVKAEQMELVQ